ncbi:UNVERIFIED_CONTAM: hypothetical protein FKN15_036523 [Acipenser sinensis]
MDSVKIEAVLIKEEFPELELVPISGEFSGLASLPIKQELCEMQCDSSQPEVSEIKAEQNELEIPQTEEPLPVKQEEAVDIVCIKWEPPEVEFDHVEPGKEESEDFQPKIPEPEPVCLRECSVGLERFCAKEQGAGEEGCLNSKEHTEDQGNKLKLVGWVKNTPRDTVVGQVQGPRETVQIMKTWLRTVGSPMSRIDKVTFTNETQISSLEFSSFTTSY